MSAAALEVREHPWVAPRHAKPIPLRGGAILDITRHADAMAVLRNPLIGPLEPWTEIARVGARAGKDYSRLINLLQSMLLSANHPDHARLRNLIRKTLTALAPGFTPAVIDAIICERLAALRGLQRFEAMEHLCRAIPTTLIVQALGLSGPTVDAIRRASTSIFAIYSLGLPLRLLDALEADAVSAESAILAESERPLRDSGLAALIELNRREFNFSPRALAGVIFFLVLASVESLTGLLANIIVLLDRYPDMRRQLAADRDLIPAFIEEAIRYGGSVRWLAPRVALADTGLHEESIRKGTMLLVELEQAHHDPSAYDHPEIFDLHRKGPPNLGFGLGAHACLGAAIARQQSRSFVDALLDEPPLVPINPRLDWEAHASFRRLRQLDVMFRS